MAAVRSPLGSFGTSPTRMTWAPDTAPEPIGFRAFRASLVAEGSDEPPDRRIGAASGGEEKTDAAIAACQSSVGARTTTDGWVPPPVEGYSARATPAASTIGSPPFTRVVFLVARYGKPICWGAFELL